MVPGWPGPTAHAGLVIVAGPVRGLACNGGGALGQAGLARCLADGQWGLEAGLAGGVGT